MIYMKAKNVSADCGPASSGLLYAPQAWDKASLETSTMDELLRSNKELEHFAFLAAHDLQEPLKVAQSYAQLLQDRYHGELDDRADSMISAILKSNERMQRLIQSLLLYARAGNGRVARKELDSRRIIERAMENLSVNIREYAAVVSCDEACPRILGDEVQLTQVFQNIIGNAIKFRKKDMSPVVHISARDEADHWAFAVRDQGVGMDPQYREDAFGLFRRFHPQSDYDGSGIGLALCKRIVEAHGGTIRLDSTMGIETTVHITIPKRHPGSAEETGSAVNTVPICKIESMRMP